MYTHITFFQFLLSAVTTSNLLEILCALAHGAKINSSDTITDDKTPILLAIEAVSVLFISAYNHFNCAFI